MGVSTATVSLVINNKPGVGEQTRREILQKIRDLGGEHLLREMQPTRENIGFVVYKRKGSIIEEAPFFSYFLEGITARLKELNYNLTILYMSSSMPEEEQQRVIELSDCVGFIVFAVEMIYEDMQAFKNSKLPFVMLDNSFSVNDVDTVAINNTCGMHKAVTYLNQRGHKSIGYIRSKVLINSFLDRFAAYLNTLNMLGLPYRPEHTATVGYSDVEARADMYSYIKSASDLPTAFVADNDLLACGALKGILDAGLKVPDDISIIGFDDRPICTLVNPELTTMMVPKAAFGDNCVDLLVGKIRSKRGYALKIEVGTLLIERESVRSIP